MSTAEGGGFDGVIWLTREDAVTFLGEAPASSMVEAIREGDGVLAGSARAEADGRFAVRVPASPAVTTYLLQARPASGAPGRPVSALRPTLEGRAPEASRVEVDTPADGRLVAGVDGAGAFAVTASLPVEGENVFLGIAFDAVGNRSEAAWTVVVRDTLPPAVPADLAVANAAGVHRDAVVVGSRTATIVGRAEAGAAVEASGDGILAPPPRPPGTAGSGST